MPFVRRALFFSETSECLFDAEITVFATRETDKVKREEGQRENRKKANEEREKRGKRDSSIITSFHLDVLDVGMIEEPSTMKSFDGFFRPTIRSTNSESQKSDLDHVHRIDDA